MSDEIKKIGKYTLEEELSRGGMGVVFFGRDDTLQRRHAIKMLPKEYFTDAEQKERFLLEARIIAKLDHPNIMKVYAYEEAENTVWIIMELLEGTLLSRMIKERGRIPPEEAAGLIDQLASALAYAHSRGIVHRDIKPANVMVSREGVVKLMDFGIARDEKSDMNLTKAGIIMGTPKYMSPEQFTGEGVDSRTDIYALGAMAYEMVCGTVPFDGKTVPEIAYKQIHEPLSSVRKKCPGISSELENFITKALAKKKTERLASLEDLHLCGETGGAAVKKVRTKARVYQFLFVVLFLFVAGAGGFYGYRLKNAQKDREMKVRALLEQADQFLLQKEWVKAKGKLAEAGALQPRNEEVLRRMEQVRDFENREQNRAKAQALFTEALKSLSADQTEEFHKKVTEAVLADPENRAAFEKQAQEKYRAYQKALALKKYTEGLALLDSGSMEDFEKKTKEAILLDEEGQYLEKSKKDLETYNKRKAGEAYDRGIKLWGENSLDPAMDAFKECIALNPGHAEAYYQMAELFFEKAGGALSPETYPVYIDCVRKSLELNPANEKAWEKLTAALSESGKTQEAREACRKGLSHYPNSVQLKNFLSSLGT